MAELIRTDGVVLRVLAFQDHDLILTVLTQALGKVSLFVKGARRPNSRFGPEIDLLAHSEFVILNHNNIKPLREAHIKTYFHRLKSDYAHLSAAMRGAKLVSQFIKDEQKDPKTLRLYFALLSVLDKSESRVELYELAFKLRLLDNFGIAPRLSGCVRCGRSSATWRFSVARGGLVCENCQYQTDTPLKPGMAQSLRALRQMEWEKLERLRLHQKEMAAGNKLLDRFIAYHVQDTLTKSLHNV